MDTLYTVHKLGFNNFNNAISSFCLDIDVRHYTHAELRRLLRQLKRHSKVTIDLYRGLEDPTQITSLEVHIFSSAIFKV